MKGSRRSSGGSTIGSSNSRMPTPKSCSGAAGAAKSARQTTKKADDSRERWAARAIGDEETIELLAWLGVESFADIAPTALERALAITDLKWLVRETKADIAATCAYFKAEGVAELSDSQLAAIVRRLSREVAA